MAQFNVHQPKSNLEPKKSFLGIGIGDPNYRGHLLSDEETSSPMSEEELEDWCGGRP